MGCWRATIALALMASAFLIAGCGSGTSTINTASDGLRTFTWPHDVLCPAFAVIPPVEGVLRGQEGAREPVWLETPDGRRLSIVWPAGFTVVFDPTAELRDNTGTVVAREGDTVKLGQTNPSEATGTYDDPYVAHGLSIGSGCYPYVKG